MGRKLAALNEYDHVICADLSPTMLREALTNAKRASRASTPPWPLPMGLRCDASRLPLRTNAITAVHVGAALHCWPRLEEGLAEVHRVLKPGGVFYATTFFQSAYNLVSDGPGPEENSGFTLFEDEAELEGLMMEAGFGRGGGEGGCVSVRREGRSCAVIKCVKSGAEKE